MLSVAKFGGSSLSNGEQYAKVKKIIQADPNRKVIVVSAPGKRFAEDNKITDLLYLCEAHLKYGVSYERVFEIIEQRFMDIRTYCHLNFDLDHEFETIRKKMNKEISVDYLVSRGEYLNANLLAEYLNFTFVDAKDWLMFEYDGKVNYQESEKRLKAIIDIQPNIVIPGFYGSNPKGLVKVFSRGGSDVTGAIVASLLDADVCENWTDVSGILMADPRIVTDPKTINRATYAELRELSYMGADVLHEDAVYPLRTKNIPLNIRNTDCPDDNGTIIRETFRDENDEEHSRFITGISGKRGFSIINISAKNMSNKVTMIRQVLEICEKYNIEIEQISSSVDSFSLIIATKDLEENRYLIIAAINEQCNPKSLKITDEISLIAVVGRQMAYRPGISGKVFATLGKNHINIRTIEQSVDEINIVIGVYNKDFEKAIRVLYNSFAQ